MPHPHTVRHFHSPTHLPEPVFSYFRQMPWLTIHQEHNSPESLFLFFVIFVPFVDELYNTIFHQSSLLCAYETAAHMIYITLRIV